jgi:predicted nucleic acid-binding protein
MNTVFADTSFYIALLRRVDELHAPAVDFDRRYDGRFLTSDFVLVELGNWVAQTSLRRAFVDFTRRLRASSRTTILPASPEWVAEGMKLYADRLDKEWSLIDCISFQMMRHHGLADALTADHHFTQAGFNALLADAAK